MIQLGNYLSRFFRLILVAAVVLAFLEVRWQIVVPGIAVGLLGYIGTEIFIWYYQTYVYLKAVEQYARQTGHTFSTGECLQAKIQWGVVIAACLALFVTAITLNIIWSTPLFVCLASLFILGVIIFWGLRQRSGYTEMRRDFAARQGWTIHGPTLQGEHQGRRAEITTIKERPSRTNRTSSVGGLTFTRLVLYLKSPVETSFLIKGQKVKKSRPLALGRHFLENAEFQPRLAAINPEEFSLHRDRLVLKRRDEACHPAEWLFLLDFLSDVAA
ncbi:MAG: hypothetical protein D6784_15210, partial [Chloroflexi bacterium]